MNSKFLLVAALLAVTLNATAQVNSERPVSTGAGHTLRITGQQKEVSGQADALRIASEQTPASPATVVFLDTLYSFDFSNRDSIVISPASGTNGYWVLGTHQEIGSGAFSTLQDSIFAATTANNGYAMFHSRGFGASANNNASLTIGPILNIPAVSGTATLNFEQRYARLNDTASVWVSNNGINFTRVGDNLNIIQRSVTTDNPHLKSVPITNFLGRDSLYVRFHFKGSNDWTWQVDDITITESELSGIDVAVETIQNGNNRTQYSYTHVPLTQVDSSGFTLIVKNYGFNAGTFTVSYALRKGADTLSRGSFPTTYTFAPGQRDTLGFTIPYVIADTGVHNISATLHVEAGDNEPFNDRMSVNQSITTGLYSPVAGLSGSYTSNTGNPPHAYYFVGQTFHMYQDQYVNGIQAVIVKPSSGFTGSHDFELVIYEILPGQTRPETDPIQEAIASFRMDNSYEDAWTDFLFDRPVQLRAGRSYVASINSYGSDNAFWYGAVNDGDLDFGTWYYIQPESQTTYDWWHITHRLIGTNNTLRLSPAIRLLMADPSIGINNAETGIKLDAYPVPASNLLNVRVKLETPSAFEVRMTDMNGRVMYHKKNASKTNLYTESIGLEQIADGFYTLQVISSEGITTKKVIITR